MVAISKKTSAATVHKLFQLLREYPDGASTGEVWGQIVTFIQSQNPTQDTCDHNSVPSFEDVSFSFVAPIKAGWLVFNKNHWSLTPEGRTAYDTFTKPEDLLSEAGKRSAQGWVASRFPWAYSTAGKTKDRVTSELRAIRRIGVSRLVKETFGKVPSWQNLLPYQSARRMVLPGPVLTNSADLLSYLDSCTLSYKEGGHAVYLSPDVVSGTMFKAITSNYPPDSGLKIIKNRGGIDKGYVNTRTKGDSRIHLGMVHEHRHLLLVANLLHLKGIGPRLYDLIEFQSGDFIWTAYVIQHIDGRMPTIEECEAGIQRLVDLYNSGLVQVILPEGFKDEEFECPDCSNNALVDQTGRFMYIDFQNFLLCNYGDYLEESALEAAETTHFGDTSVLRGGRYLYQTVPGVKLKGKRSVKARMTTLESLLKSAGVTFENRLVLDVGCNIGMMMAEYLRLGAKWCHGWDRDFTAPHTEKMLLALGCTRFSVTGGDIFQSRALEEDLPPFAKPMLDECAISYLAIRGHIGWLDALKRIPWSFLVYEGHEGESAADFENYLSEFRASQNFELGPVSSYVDGDSDERTVAILLRRP